jgi:hypothetical protein
MNYKSYQVPLKVALPYVVKHLCLSSRDVIYHQIDGSRTFLSKMIDTPFYIERFELEPSSGIFLGLHERDSQLTLEVAISYQL